MSSTKAREFRAIGDTRFHSSTGYLLEETETGYKLQHRVVMEQQLGRPLEPHENVHHLNGVKTDNRPENLELWTRSQPSGQRVTDKLEWAREIMRLYAPEELR